MASARETLALVVTADVNQAIRELDKVGKTAKRQMTAAEQSTDRWGARLQMGGAAAVGFAAIAGRALYGFAKQAEEAELAQAKLDNVLATVPALASANRQAFLDLASAIQKKTVVDDEAVISAESMLGQFGLTQQQILGLTPLVVDLARKMGVDLDTAAKTVGKAMNGQAGALSRVGIVVDQNAFATDRYKAVQEGLSQAVGGFAEREGKTFSGQLAILKNQLGEVAEGIGGGVVGALNAALGPISSVTSAFGDLDPAAQHAVGGIAAVGTAAVGAIGSVSFLAGTVMKMRERFLAVPAQGLSGGLNGFGIAAAAAGVAAIGLGAVFAAFAKSSADAERRVTELTDAVRQNGTTLGQEAANQLAKYVSKHDDLRAAMQAAGISLQDMNAAIQGNEGAYERVTAALDAYQKANTTGTTVNQEARARIQSVKTTVDDQREAFKTAKTTIDETNKATKDLSATNLDGTKATAALGQSQEELAEATEGANRKLLDQLGLVTSAPAAQRAAEQAVRDAVSAQQALAEKTQIANRTIGPEHSTAVVEQQNADKQAKDSIDRVAESAAVAAQKQAELNGKQLDATGSAAAQKEALIKLRDQIADPAMRGYIDSLIASLDRLAQNRTGKLSYYVEINGQRVYDKNFVGPLDPTKNNVYRAAGGPVAANQSYVVGEQGPELFVPKQDGTIVPNDVLQNSKAADTVINAQVMPAAAGPQIVVNQTVNAIDPYSAAREASRDVAWALKTTRF